MNTSGSLSLNWKSIRLELAETAEFPRGSASRAYMLHLPLLEDGTIDEASFLANPSIAGFRRFWPNEPDRHGFIVRTDCGWALSFRPPLNGEDAPFPIVMNRLLPGEIVGIEKHDGGNWRFRVVDLTPQS